MKLEREDKKKKNNIKCILNEQSLKRKQVLKLIEIEFSPKKFSIYL